MYRKLVLEKKEKKQQQFEEADEDKAEYDTGLIYYYPDPNDMRSVEEGGLNLSIRHRPWFTTNALGERIMFPKDGRKVFSDPFMYKPIDMKNYIEQNYIVPFKGRRNPFKHGLEKIGGLQLQPHQKFAGQYICNQTDFPGLLVYHALGSGKCFSVDTPILMYDGSIKMVQDVKVGDIVMGDDSTPRNVLNLVRGRDTMYEVIPTKGDSYTFNSEHILSLKCTNSGISYRIDKRVKNQKKKWSVQFFNNESITINAKWFETEDEARTFFNNIPEKSKICNISIKKFLKVSKDMKAKLKLYKVPIEFPYREVPFDPYTIGFWIGDGHSDGPTFTVQDSEVVTYLKNMLFSKYKNLHLTSTAGYKYRICKVKGRKNPFLETLRDLKLVDNKHIPDIYKINSRQVRLELLAGLLDSDGHFDNGCYEFSQKNEATMDGVIYLARSLGFSAYKAVKKTSWNATKYQKAKPVSNNSNLQYDTAHSVTYIKKEFDEEPLELAEMMAKFNITEDDINNEISAAEELEFEGSEEFEESEKEPELMGKLSKEEMDVVRKNTEKLYEKIPEKRYGSTFRITISGDVNEIPCKIQRKKASPRLQIKDVLVNSLTVVEKPVDDYYGFTIDSNNLFVLGDFTVTHNSATSIIVAEAMKTQFIKEETVAKIESRAITINREKVYCSITVVVPPGIIKQYLTDIKGSIQDGILQSFTGICKIYTEKDGESYFQNYVGRYKKGSNPPIYEVSEINQVNENNDKISSAIEEIKKIKQEERKLDKKDPEYNKKSDDLYKRKASFLKKIETYKRNIEVLEKNIDKKINEIYFIVSANTFTNRLKDYYNLRMGLAGAKSKEKEKENLRYQKEFSCFSSQKNLIIIDEVHKTSNEGTEGHDALFNTLYIYGRELFSGEKSTKVVLLTATPIFDKPFQMASSLNVLRPRILFPLREEVFNNMFINEHSNIKNKMLLKYMLSGYVSYFKSSSMEHYPYRRNFIKQHKMHSYQENLYNKYRDKERRKLRKDIGENDARFAQQFNLPRTLATSLIAYHNTSGNEKAKSDLTTLFEWYKDQESFIHTFKEYSAKLEWIAQHVNERAEMEDNGPVFIYSSRVSRGIIPLVLRLISLGFKLLHYDKLDNPDELFANNEKYIGIFGGTALDFFIKDAKNEIGTNDVEVYKDKLKTLFNDERNKNGKLCNVLIGIIDEGDSFKYINEIHVCDMWWNESKMEQIIGRGIRFHSHEKLPANRKYVDVYYHFSVYNYDDKSVKDFIRKKLSGELHVSKKDQELEKMMEQEIEKIGEPSKEMEKGEAGGAEGAEGEEEEDDFDDILEAIEMSKKIEKEESEKKKPFYYSSTIDQIIYTTAKKKNNLNKQFEMCLKQAAVDYELNKNGNITTFEEFNIPSQNNMDEYDTLFYIRSTDKYYLKINGDKFAECIVPNEWPLIYIVNPQGLIREIRHHVGVDNHGRSMLFTINLKEEYESDMNMIEFAGKNFFELRDYAVGALGEEKGAWKLAESMYIKDNLMTLICKGLLEPSKRKLVSEAIVTTVLDKNIKKEPDDLTRSIFDKYIKSNRTSLNREMLIKNIRSMLGNQNKEIPKGLEYCTTEKLNMINVELEKRRKKEKKNKEKTG